MPMIPILQAYHSASRKFRIGFHPFSEPCLLTGIKVEINQNQQLKSFIISDIGVFSNRKNLKRFRDTQVKTIGAVTAEPPI